MAPPARWRDASGGRGWRCRGWSGRCCCLFAVAWAQVPCRGTDNQVYIVSRDWLRILCSTRFHDPALLPPANAVEPLYRNMPKYHHPAFLAFRPWSGHTRTKEGILIDFLGMTIPWRLFCNDAYNFQRESHAIRTRQCALFSQIQYKGDGHLQFSWPVVAEEYFEYIDVLSAVREFPGGRPFAFVELGCGYGHWTFSAHRALMQKHADARYRYVLVDILDSLAKAIRYMARLNDVRDYHYHVGYMSPNHTMTPAMLKRANENLASYGQDWGVGPPVNITAGLQPVTLAELFASYKLPRIIDMVDLDIQRAEYAVLDDNTVDLLTARVKRVHIGTHLANTAELTPPIVHRFIQRGWRVVWNFDHGHRVPTPYGHVKFGDGVLSFQNTRLLGA